MVTSMFPIVMLDGLPGVAGDLAVVPVFVNAGAAVLPAVIGALASVAVVLAKPKVLAPVLLVTALVVGGAWYFWPAGDGAPPPAPMADRGRRTTAASAGEADWSAVGMAIIQHRQRQEALGRTAGPAASNDRDEAAAEDPTDAREALIFRGGVQRSGHLGGGSPVELVEQWRSADPDTMYLASPLVADGRVYAASCYLMPGGSEGGVFALDAATGDERWYVDTKPGGGYFTGFFSSPALSADRKTLVIGQGLHVDANCELIGVDVESGEIKWTAPTPLHVEGSPAIEGGIVVAGAGAIEQGEDHLPRGDPEGRGHPGFVFGVDIASGEELWRYQVNDPESSPAVEDGVAYIGSGVNGNAVVALRTAPQPELDEAGQERLVWETETPYAAVGPVTLTEDLVLIGCGNSNFVFADPNPAGVILALDRETGAVVWEHETNDSVLGAIAVRDGIAIAAVRTGEVLALDIASGETHWSVDLGEGPVLSSPAYTGACVYLTTADGYLVVLDAMEQGAVIEKHYINAPGAPGERALTVSSPLVQGGNVYVGSETGGLICFTGKHSR